MPPPQTEYYIIITVVVIILIVLLVLITINIRNRDPVPADSTTTVPTIIQPTDDCTSAPTKPGPPILTLLSATSVLATWGVPQGSSDPTFYRITLIGGADNRMEETSLTGITFPDLIPGTVYTVTVTAVNSCGQSVESDPSFITTCSGAPSTAPIVKVGSEIQFGLTSADEYRLSIIDISGPITIENKVLRCTSCAFTPPLVSIVNIAAINPCGINFKVLSFP